MPEGSFSLVLACDEDCLAASWATIAFAIGERDEPRVEDIARSAAGLELPLGELAREKEGREGELGDVAPAESSAMFTSTQPSDFVGELAAVRACSLESRRGSGLEGAMPYKATSLFRWALNVGDATRSASTCLRSGEARSKSLTFTGDEGAGY